MVVVIRETYLHEMRSSDGGVADSSSPLGC
jgi:hypothetical protein